MRFAGFALVWVLSAAVFGCGADRDTALEDSRADDGVLVELEGVVVHQYSGQDLRFELHMGKVLFYRGDEELEATGGIQGFLMAPVWDDDNVE